MLLSKDLAELSQAHGTMSNNDPDSHKLYDNRAILEQGRKLGFMMTVKAKQLKQLYDKRSVIERG